MSHVSKVLVAVAMHVCVSDSDRSALYFTGRYQRKGHNLLVVLSVVYCTFVTHYITA